MNGGTCGRAQVVFGGSNQPNAKGAESVAQGRSLRDRGHLHAPQRNADDGAQNQGDRDPRIIDNPSVQQGRDNGEQHAEFSGPDAAPGGSRSSSAI